MPTLTIPKSFFRKERDTLYPNWPVAFWRELFQNSTDAKATTIRVSIESHDGFTRVRFDDDGVGMNRKILEEVYFRLGASTKDGVDEGQIGGFGRARILTCFSMRRYAIRTGTLLAEGDGPHYELSDDYVPRPGCLVEVDIDQGDCSEDTLRSALRDYLGMSQMHCRVFVDGARFTEWLYRGRITRTLSTSGDPAPFATVHVNRSGPFKGRILVRVDGTYMFTVSISRDVQIILEIDRAKSRQVLVANRDSMAGQYAAALNRFVEELAANTRSAIKTRRLLDYSTVVSGTGFIVTYGDKSLKAAIAESANDADRNGRSAAGAGGRQEDPSPIAAWSIDEAHLDAITDEGLRSLPRKSQASGSRLPDVHILDDASQRIIRRSIPQYDPRNWDIDRIVKHASGRGYTHYRLLAMWQAACSEALRALLQVTGTDRIAWSIGWYFTDPDEESGTLTRAVCRSVGGGHLFCLNPLDAKGRMAWRISDRRSLKRLLAIAKHEVVHVVHKWHDEDFANLLTNIDAEIDEARALRRIRSA
jgi:hypothetical protein